VQKVNNAIPIANLFLMKGHLKNNVMSVKVQFIPRDISWLSFNGRVLQEANDPTVPLSERIRFLGIFSNNLDEFFRVRVATLRRMIEFAEKRKKLNMHMEDKPQQILEQIQTIVLQQQNEFNRIWEGIRKELQQKKVLLLTEKELSKEQQAFVRNFFEEQVENSIIPLMIETLPHLPYLRDKSIYLGVVMRKHDSAYLQKYALIEVPSKAIGRFVQLPAPAGEHHIILLEDVIRYNLPFIFSYFGYDHFTAHVFKVTKDAELDIDNEVATNLVEKIEKGLKNRRKGKAVRFVYDKEMDAGLLEYLIRRLNLSRKDNIIPGGRIHNFRHFMDFPNILEKTNKRKPLQHPAFKNQLRTTDIILKQDVLLHLPYHSFDPIIDLLREAAMDPQVQSIKITAYRLATNSKIINALINAVRNGKQVVVMLELRARFDEEANLEWKKILEEEGVKVIIGVPNMKVHAKLCVIKKKVGTQKLVYYGFVSTGNLNEKTARVYADHCLLTSNKNIMADINRMFRYLENPKPNYPFLRACKTLLTTPIDMRKTFLSLLQKEIQFAREGKPAGLTVKVNSLSDKILIQKMADAAQAGVKVQLIVRGIYCVQFNDKKTLPYIKAISIVDEYLEHARVLVFEHGGKPKVYISSADWMVRNLDHRIEAAAPITDPVLQAEIIDILQIQLKDNVKARILNSSLNNEYVSSNSKKKFRSQVETYLYLQQKS